MAALITALVTMLVTSCAPVPEVAQDPEGAGAAVEPGPGAAAPVAGGTLRFALGADPVSIDPRGLVDPEGELVARALFEPPLDLDPDGRLVPAAAEAFAWEDEGRTLVLTVREAAFHDGSPVTAVDLARAVERVADDAVAPRFRSDLVAGVVAVEVVDDRTLVLRLDAPRPGLLLALTDLAFAPVPAMADEDPETFAARPIGNGPFAMAEPRSPGEFLRLVRVEAHHRRARLDELLFVVQDDDASGEARWRDLGAGLLQVADVPATRRQEAIALHGAGLDGQRGPGHLGAALAAVHHYAFDVTRAPFDDVRVRRAISAAIDRERIATEVLGGTHLPADRILPPSLGVPVLEGAACDHCRRDPELALTYPRTAVNAAVAEAIARDLEQVLGAEVRLQGRDLPGFVRAVEAGEAGVFRLGLSVASDGPRAAAELLVPRFLPDRAEAWTRFDAPGLTRRLGGLAADPAAELLAAQEVEAELLDQAVVVPLLWPRRDLVVAEDVEGLVLTPGGRWWPELVRLRTP